MNTIVQLSSTHLPDAFAVICDVIQNMESHSIFQWDEIYPSMKDLETDINQGNAYGYFTNNTLAGYICLNECRSPEYEQLSWKSNAEKPLIVHRLSVRSSHQNQGIAKNLMLFTESFANENKYSSIRLDAYIANPHAVRLYESMNYSKVGIVQFRKGSFYCYEKNLREEKN